MKQLSFDTIGKVCTKCGKWKPLDEFHKHQNSRYGYRPTCKVCRSVPKTPYQLECIKLERSNFRRCKECNRIKPLNDFQYHGRERHRYYICKDCTYPNRRKLQESRELFRSGRRHCNICGETKTLNEFPYRPGRQQYEYSCKACIAKQKREYAIENRVKIRARQDEWLKRKLEENPDYAKEQYAKHRENNLARSHKYHTEHQEELRTKARKYYAEHREKVIAYQKKYNVENPDKIRTHRIRRRSRESGSGGSYTVEEWQALCNKYDNRCLCCGSMDEPLTIDHIIPISKGGNSNIDNIQPLCKSCNCSKQSKIIDYRPDQ